MNKLVQILQMFVRGTFLFFMGLGFLFNSEVPDLTSLNHFVMSGVYGSFVVVTLGLITETAMNLPSDAFIERILVLLGALFNIVVAALAFYEFYSGIDPYKECMHKGFVSCVSCVTSLADLIIIQFKK